MRWIYRICNGDVWAEAERNGKFIGSEVDLRDGFIHFATHEQVGETAAKHFSHVRGLVLVMVDAELLGPALKWETSRGGGLFPHLYAPLDPAAAISMRALPDGEPRTAFFAGLPDESPDAGTLNQTGAKPTFGPFRRASSEIPAASR